MLLYFAVGCEYIKIWIFPFIYWSLLMTNLDSILKSRDITLSTKVHLVKYFSSGHVWMWELDYKESRVPKNWCFWTVGEDSWESLGLQGNPTSLF